jgi:hypothetical protein
MISLVNEKIEHIKFGKGTIVSEDKVSITIDFGQGLGIKSFLFPEAFEKFLKLENNTLQEECLDFVMKKKEALEQEAFEKHEAEKRKEQERLEEERKIKSESSKKKRSITKKAVMKKEIETVL